MMKMNPRPLPNTLESLRTTLQKLEQTSNPDQDEASLNELKRVLVNRIADLELSQALSKPVGEAAERSEPDELVPPPSTPEPESAPAPLDSTPLQKLD
jgi:hypothetical protein